MKKILFASFITILCLSIFSCGEEGFETEKRYYTDEEYEVLQQYLNIENVSLDYTQTFPAYYGSSTTRQYNNSLAALGRVLFYDTNLSDDRTISCASCHKQELAFADDVALSKGVNNRETDRNSLALGSVFSFNEYYGSISSGRVPFFWDNRASSVQEQSIQTFGNPDEMNIQMHQVLDRVEEQPYYEPLFNKAYGDNAEISEQRILDAINEFINSMGSYDSKYDRALNSLPPFNITSPESVILSNRLVGFSEVEDRGKELFINDCSSCHGAVNGFPGKRASNNGLDTEFLDQGVYSTTGSQSDRGKFKVPTLRNITLTAPYMHDGRFATLEEVIDHYSDGIEISNTLDFELNQTQTNSQGKKGFAYSAEDKAALLAFFETLVDNDFITTTKYADPFK